MFAIQATYPEKDIIMIFDQSSVHKQKNPSTLDAFQMNLNPGGKQPIFSDTNCNGARKTFCFPNDHLLYPGLAKGAKQIAIERGIPVKGKNCKETQKILASWEDFKNQKSMTEEATQMYYLIFSSEISL
jgi:hypothetical protein